MAVMLAPERGLRTRDSPLPHVGYCPDSGPVGGQNRAMPLRLGLSAVATSVSGVVALVVARESPGFSFAADSVTGTVALLGAGLATALCGLAHLVRRPDNRVGLLLVGTGTAWFLSEWDSPAVGSALVLSVGLALAASWPAVMAHLVLAYPTGRLSGRVDHAVAAAGYLVTIGLVGVGPALFFDPGTQGCSGCADNLLLVTDDAARAADLSSLGVRAVLAWSAVAAATVLWRLATSSAARRLVVGWVAVPGAAGLAVVATSYAVSLDRGFLGTTSLDRRLWLAEAGTLVALAAAAAWGLWRTRRTHRALAGLVVDLGRAGAPGGLRDALAALLGDPSLEVAYRVGDGRYVDASARPVRLPPGPGRETTAVGPAGADIAVLVHRPGLLANPDLVDELGSATHLGLENERLQAEALTQLADLRASRARIVVTGDEERRRLERDLHDGAQQRLVGLSLALRLLRSRDGSGSPQLAAAETELRAAIDDLRELARGLFPVVLRDEGLGAALGALGETASLRVTAVPPRRFADSVETTAYLVVARAAVHGPTTICATHTDGVLALEVTVEAMIDGLGDLEDRVRALDGELTTSRGALGTQVHLTLPVGDDA
jgi:signal transduction histidine kinase